MENWKFKRFIKIIIYCEIISFSLFFCLVIIDYFTGMNTFTNKENILLETFGLLGFGLLVAAPVTIFQLVKKVSKKKHEIKNKDFFRDIDEKYTPAIASFLIDNEVEESKDILATILDLKNRNYLEITDDFKITIKNKNTDNLYLHEKYIIKCIEIKNFINVYEFRDLVKKDCKNDGLIKDRNFDLLLKILFRFLIIEVSIVLVTNFTLSIITWVKKSTIFLNTYNTVTKALWYICIASFVIAFFILVVIRKHNWTKKGKEIAIKFKGLKNYLKEYTLVKTRDLEYVNVLDRYLTFALALGEADKIEKLYVPYNKLISKYILGGK